MHAFLKLLKWCVVFIVLSVDDARGADYTISIDVIDNSLFETDVVVVQIDGTISQSMAADVARLSEVRNLSNSGSLLLVLLNSSGGDGEAAITMGEIFRSLGAHVFVTGRCDSACVFLLAGGIVRGASAYTVGLHRARIVTENTGADVNTDGFSAEVAEHVEILQQFEQRSADYLEAMGIGEQVQETMLRYQRRTVYRLALEELVASNLVGVSIDEFNRVPQSFSANFDEQILSRATLKSRILSVALRCSRYGQAPNDFAACYWQRLSRPY